jgi:hypothetical protein
VSEWERRKKRVETYREREIGTNRERERERERDRGIRIINMKTSAVSPSCIYQRMVRVRVRIRVGVMVRGKFGIGVKS